MVFSRWRNVDNDSEDVTSVGRSFQIRDTDIVKLYARFHYSGTWCWQRGVGVPARTMLPEVDLSRWILCLCVVALSVDAEFVVDDDRLLRFRVLEELPAGTEVGTIRPPNVDETQLDQVIVVINVYKRYFYFFYKNSFLTFFLFFQRFFLSKTLNSQCENNGTLKHLCTKTEKIKVLSIQL